MSNPNDDLFLWTFNHMPIEVLELSNQLGISRNVHTLFTDPTEHTDSIFYSRGKLATIRTAVLLFLIDYAFPQDQHWLFYWLVVSSRQNLARKVYVAARVQVLLLWYFPALGPRMMYYLLLGLDWFIRGSYARTGVLQEQLNNIFINQLWSLGAVGIFFGYQNLKLERLAAWFELLLGPASFWPWAVFPILPGLEFIDERAPINAFTPESSEGLVMAAALWGLMKLLPKWVQWGLWPIYSAPDTNKKGMTSKWVLCTALWMWLDTPTPVAYGLYLFADLFPLSEQALRMEDGGPSKILRQQRYGLLCFVVMTFLLRLAEVKEKAEQVQLFSLSMPMWGLVLIIPIIAFGIDILQTKLSARRIIFKHKPLKDSNQIRLLRLRPRYLSKNQQIHCDMLHVDLMSPPDYIAISYRWGPTEENAMSIMINDAPFRISKTLYTLLLSKRKSRHFVLLWIDAICINQSNVEEKSQQVSLMRRIFEDASSTIAWLGDDPAAGKAMELVQRINRTPNLLFSKNFQQESNSGWKELSKLATNEWFQRVWVIQEIAVSQRSLVRYGKQEVEWKELVDAFSHIITSGSAIGVPENLFHSHAIVNSLVIENIRLCVDRVDYLHLEDVLKLGAMFQATLPVDKVFALLGVTENNNGSFLRLDYSADIPDMELWHAKNLFHDLYRTVETINAASRNLTEVGNSRTSRFIRSRHNMRNYGKSLVKDVNRILEELVMLAKNRKNIPAEDPKEYDILRPEYSTQTTPESVYSLVAKVAIGKGSINSIIRHAGIGSSRDADLQNLPSWAADWSSPLQVYILPFRTPRTAAAPPDQNPEIIEGKPTIVKGEEQSTLMVASLEASKNEESISYASIRDASFGFHYVRGRLTGRIRHLVTLSTDMAGNCTDDPANVVEAARLDFQSQISHYTEAFSLVQQFCHERYNTREAIESAFFRTILADVGRDGCSPASESEVTRCKNWVYGTRDDCQIAAALKHPGVSSVCETKLSAANGFDTEQICSRYLFVRRMQCSTSTKFAHMIRTEILPSFNKYRLQDDDTKDSKADSTREGKVKDQHLSFFDHKDAGPLRVYSEYVDYTLGRRLAITDSGHMGLVPWGAQNGDIIVNCSSEKLCLLLRKSKPPNLGSKGSNKKGSTLEEMFRLVGEAYIHDIDESEDELKRSEEKRFKLW